MIRALVMTHGDIGHELVRVVEMIIGPVLGLTAMSNAGRSGADLQSDIAAWLAEGEPGAGEIIFIDDYGGSCATAAVIACQDKPNRAIVAGVNLAMLLGYVTWRDRDEHQALVARLVQKGREAIVLVGGR